MRAWTHVSVRRIVTAVVPLVIVLSPARSWAGTGTTPADSLTDNQKRLINRMAVSTLERYMGLLDGLAFLSSSDEATLEAEEYIMDAVNGAEPIFHSPDATIESNVDPELPSDALSRNRTVKEYLNDYKLLFRSNGPKAVDFTMVMRAEPHVRNGIVYTRVLYEMRFNGHHEMRPGAAYQRHRRIAEMIAQETGGGNWAVRIASDRFDDSGPSRPFEQFSVDRDLAAVQQGTLTETPELARVRKEEEEARKKTAQAETEKKNAYQVAIEQGDQYLGANDPELALEMYDRAATIDAAAATHIIRKKQATRAFAAKIKVERERALDTLVARLAVQLKAREFSSVTVQDFTEADGRTSTVGQYLAGQVTDRLTDIKYRFRVWDSARQAKAQVVIKGQLLPSGSGKDMVTLNTNMNDARGLRVGGAQVDMPLPAGFSISPSGEPIIAGQDKEGPPGTSAKKKGRSAWGITAGVNLTSITDQDSLTEKFVDNGTGFRVGLELERSSPEGHSRFVTGIRYSGLKTSTSADDTLRVLEVHYLQVPVLYRLFTGPSSIGRFGLQLGVNLDYLIGTKSESYVPDQWVNVANFNAHASPGICYETAQIGQTRIVASASYDLMLGPLSGDNFPESGPRLNALSFAIGVMFPARAQSSFY